jgi:hypothetical protein
MEKVYNYVTEFLFGVRVEGEPIDMSLPKPQDVSPNVDPLFFEWCEEFKVGCQFKNKPTFW